MCKVQVTWCTSAVEAKSESEVIADWKGECNSACWSNWSPAEAGSEGEVEVEEVPQGVMRC